MAWRFFFFSFFFFYIVIKNNSDAQCNIWHIFSLSDLSKLGIIWCWLYDNLDNNIPVIYRKTVVEFEFFFISNGAVKHPNLVWFCYQNLSGCVHLITSILKIIFFKALRCSQVFILQAGPRWLNELGSCIT